MRRRQTGPGLWLIVRPGDERQIAAGVRRLPRGSGVLVLGKIADARRLRALARSRRLVLVEEGPRTAARVHDLGELRSALLRGVPLILLSPIHPTASHPGWKPIARMRAAAYARLAGRRLIALGGMDGRRYARIASLGFIGWAGISAFRT